MGMKMKSNCGVVYRPNEKNITFSDSKECLSVTMFCGSELKEIAMLLAQVEAGLMAADEAYQWIVHGGYFIDKKVDLEAGR